MDRPLFPSPSPLSNEGDILLADVLARFQQPPGKYEIAEERYQTLAGWIERDGSPLKGAVSLVYPQGGVAQGSSIASRATNDEFDVDAMVELLPHIDRGPAYVLDLLYHTVRGEPGSRYYSMTTRCTRCVQVGYADRMHVDLTPAVLQIGTPLRESTIFHHRPEDGTNPGMRVTGNPYGFTEWFKLNTPPELMLKAAFDEGRAYAATEPLPEQIGMHGMSRALASLQFAKRFRNLRYDRRDRRCPPSVLLAKLVAQYKAHEVRFAAAVLEHMRNLLDIFAVHQSRSTLIHEVNPTCSADVLTDRWPNGLGDQALWISDLRHLVAQLDLFVNGEITLTQRKAILADLFGEQAAGDAVLAFAERMGRMKDLGQTRYAGNTGRLILPGAALLTGTRAQAMPHTSYFGGRLK